MKTRRKLRQRLLPLDFARPANAVDHTRGRELFAKMKAGLQAGTPDTRPPQQ